MPLAPEPFLVRGVQAQLDGDRSLAGQAFRAAELRDGRAIPARYFLADHYFRTGDARAGLREVAALSRLVPNGVASLAPYVAAYSKDPRNWPALQGLVQVGPGAPGRDACRRLPPIPAMPTWCLPLGDVRNRPATRDVAGQARREPRRGPAIWQSARNLDADRRRLAPGDGIFDPGFTQSDRAAAVQLGADLVDRRSRRAAATACT